MNRLLILIVLALLVAPATLRASQVVPLTIEELNAIATDVVHGVVEYSETDVHNGIFYTLHTVRVEESFKGSRKVDSEVQVPTIGGRIGKLAAISPGMPTLEPGEEVILFLSTPSEATAQRQREAGIELNEESPFISNPQIVGGFQGKFNVLRVPVRHEAQGHTFFTESSRVHRAGSGVDSRPANAPGLQIFADQLRDINSGQRARDTRSREIPLVGRREVVARDTEATALRHFDPVFRSGPDAEDLRLIQAPAGATPSSAPSIGVIPGDRMRGAADGSSSDAPVPVIQVSPDRGALRGARPQHNDSGTTP